MVLAGSRVVGVHGVAKQQLGRHQFRDPWRRALADGIERATGRPSVLPSLDLAYYGDLFLPAGDGSNAAGGLPAALLEDLSVDETTELDSALAEPGAGRSATDPVEKGHLRAPAALQAGIRSLDRRFGTLVGVLCLGELRQISRYLHEPALRDQVHARIGAVLTADCRVLIGHSLGSVATLAHLLRHPERRLDLLLTFGSPLGLRFIREGLAGALEQPARPPGVARWVNVRDPHEPVASVRWAGVEEVAVNNQSASHAVERYLGKQPTGAAVVAALPELAR
jgi:hypothetical protein